MHNDGAITFGAQGNILFLGLIQGRKNSNNIWNAIIIIK